MVVSEGVCPGVCTPFGTRQELTSRARQNLTTNRPRRLCLCGEHGLVALGLAALRIPSDVDQHSELMSITIPK